MLKRIMTAVMALIAGIILALYGVFLSVFADGNMNERLMLIGVVLILFFVISFSFSKIRPQQAVLSVILTAFLSIVVLIIQPLNEYIILYITLIIVACGLGFILGKKSAKKTSVHP